MSLLLINVRLYSQDQLDQLSTELTETVEVSPEVNKTIVFSGDDVRETARWRQMDIASFICAAIEGYLSEAQAAMEEERIGGS